MTNPVWDAFEQVDLIPNDGWAMRSGDIPADWTHINGLAADPTTGKV